MSERLNIKNMLVEPESKSEKIFDPETDIPESDWKRAISYFHSTKDDIQSYASHAPELVILGKGEEVQPIPHFQLEREREKNITIRAGEPPTSGRVVAQYLARMAILGIKVIPSEVEKKLIKDNFDTFCADENGPSAVDVYVNAKIIGLSMELPDDARDDALNYLDTMPEQYPLNQEAGLQNWLQLAADLRLAGVTIPVPGATWQACKVLLTDDMREYVVVKREEQYKIGDLLNDAKNMAILAADEVVIPAGGGLRLINHSQRANPEGMPPLPNQRNF